MKWRVVTEADAVGTVTRTYEVICDEEPTIEDLNGALLLETGCEPGDEHIVYTAPVNATGKSHETE